MEETLTQDRQEAIAHARAVDEQIAAAWDVYWAHPWHAAVAKAQEAEKDARRYGYSADIMARRQQRAVEMRAKADELAAGAREARAAAVALDQELYGGWQRFFQVQHLHASQHCQSFRPTTRVGWLPDLSGLTEPEAVAKYGAILCTHCFPTAPVEWTRGPQADPSVCPGSNRPYDTTKTTGRERVYYSPSGYCTECGQVVGLTARNSIKIRKHKKEA